MNIWNIISLLKLNLIVYLRVSFQGEKNIWWWKTHGSCYISSWLNFVFSSPSSAAAVCRLCKGLWRQVWCRDRQGGQERRGLRVPGQNWEARVAERLVSSHHITSHHTVLCVICAVISNIPEKSLTAISKTFECSLEVFLNLFQRRVSPPTERWVNWNNYSMNWRDKKKQQIRSGDHSTQAWCVLHHISTQTDREVIFPSGFLNCFRLLEVRLLTSSDSSDWR